MSYRGVFPRPFDEELRRHTANDRNLRRMADDAIRVILEYPRGGGAKQLKSYGGFWRKHVCGNNYRMMYDIYEHPEQVVVFLYFRQKNNKTYKNILRYYSLKYFP